MEGEVGVACFHRRGVLEFFLRLFLVSGIKIGANVASPHLLGRHRPRAAAAERIQHDVAFIRRHQDHPFDQMHRQLARMGSDAF